MFFFVFGLHPLSKLGGLIVSFLFYPHQLALLTQCCVRAVAAARYNATDPLVPFCADVWTNLVPPPTSSKHGGLISGDNFPDNPSTSTLQDMEAYFPIFPIKTMNMYKPYSSSSSSSSSSENSARSGSDPDNSKNVAIIQATCNEYNSTANAKIGHPGVMNNDLAYTMIAGMNIAAGNGNAAHSNLTAFLNTDKKRMHSDGKLVEYGCSRPCLHDKLDNRSFCAPCVGFNTMVEEGSNPILEGSIAIASNILDMLLQDYFCPPPAAKAIGSGEDDADVDAATSATTGSTLLVVFAGTPLQWKEAVFHNLRAAGAFLVSGKLSNGKAEWVQVASEAGVPVELAADFGTDNLVVQSLAANSADNDSTSADVERMRMAANVTLQKTGDNRWEIVGLHAGETVVIMRKSSAEENKSKRVGGPHDNSDDVKVNIAPIAPDAAELNYYGFRRDEW